MKSIVFFSEKDKIHRNSMLIVPIMIFIALIFSLFMKLILNVEVKNNLIYFMSFGLILISTLAYMIYNQCRYIIDNEYIEIYIGPFMRKSIPICEILEIRSKRKTQAIYGNSFNTISIILNIEKEINISPENKKAFIETLFEINNNIIIT